MCREPGRAAHEPLSETTTTGTISPLCESVQSASRLSTDQLLDAVAGVLEHPDGINARSWAPLPGTAAQTFAT